MIDPKNISLLVENEEEKSATFVVRPLTHGFGRTLGNSLRRVLLSSIEGAAITEARFFDGVSVCCFLCFVFPNYQYTSLLPVLSF